MQIFVKRGVDARAYGGFDAAERKQIGFAPSYDACDTLPYSSYPITPLNVTYNGKYSRELTHRDFLGAVLGLGLDRCKVGDILIGDEGAVMYISRDIVSFITDSLHVVGRTPVATSTRTNLDGIQSPGTVKRITAASLRVDAIISVAFNLSRSKAAVLIEREKVFVNWAIAKKTQQLSPGDIVTIRGMGRVRLDDIIGQTKKDRVALSISVF